MGPNTIFGAVRGFRNATAPAAGEPEISKGHEKYSEIAAMVGGGTAASGHQEHDEK